MLEVNLRRGKIECESLKNKGKTIYADKNQYPLERIREIKADGTFEIDFYTRFGVFNGESYEDVEKVEKITDEPGIIEYKIVMESETEHTTNTIKSVSY